MLDMIENVNYIVFAFGRYYPAGGACDMIGRSALLSEAMEIVRQHKKTWEEDGHLPIEFYQILNVCSGMYEYFEKLESDGF